MSYLMRNWPLLEMVLVPALVAAAPRGAAWVVGRVDDAVATILAFLRSQDGGHDGGRTTDVQVYLSGLRRPLGQLQFARADLRGVPDLRRLTERDWLQPVGGRWARWVPGSEVTRRIVLGEPTGPVDLVSCPGTSAAHTGGPPWARLRKGGLLYVGDGGESPPASHFKAHPLHSGLFERVSELSAPVRVVADAGPPATLERCQREARLVESHLNLARSLARRFTHSGESLEDLEQVAFAALVNAARRYDPDHGSPFSSFATASVLGELKRHFRDKTWMLRVPRSLQEDHLRVKAAVEELSQKLRASPNVAQIADYLGTTSEAVLAAMEAADNYWTKSLDAPSRDDEAPTDVPVTDDGFDRRLDLRELRDAMPSLSPAERLVLKRVYFDGWTQRRVAAELGCSQMQISRMMEKTIRRLRRNLVAS